MARGPVALAPVGVTGAATAVISLLLDLSDRRVAALAAGDHAKVSPTFWQWSVVYTTPYAT